MEAIKIVCPQSTKAHECEPIQRYTLIWLMTLTSKEESKKMLVDIERNYIIAEEMIRYCARQME